MLYKPKISRDRIKNIKYAAFSTCGNRARKALSQPIECIETGEVFESMTIAANKFNMTVQKFSKTYLTGIEGFTFKKVSK